MPTVKVTPGKIVVCCGDSDCVEIDTEAGSSSEGGNDYVPPYEPPPISGGTAVYAPRSIIERLVMTRKVSKESFESQLAKIESRTEAMEGDKDTELTLQLVVPRGSRLSLVALNALSERLGANLEVRFAKDEQE